VSEVENLIAACQSAVAETEPLLAVRDVLERALAGGKLTPEVEGSSAGLNVLYNAPDLTVINVIWPPRMSLFPHDHRMWAAIGIYGGVEDNSFYRRDGGQLVGSGGKRVGEGEVLMLGEQTIHAVDNPARAYTGGIHVYGGDFIGTPRSQWDPQTLREEPWDLEAVHREFARAEQVFSAGGE
jgi:predicted metal-dependent enzyme (double-stranded beta helix superfamily)